MFNKKLKSIIALTVLSALLSGCSKNTSLETNNPEANNPKTNNIEASTKAASNKSLSDLFASDFDEAEDNYDDSLSDMFSTELNQEDDSEINADGTYSHTIMIYMVGSDLESNYGHASRDIAEMLNAHPDLDNNNVVIYTGGASKWQLSGIDSNKNYILELMDGDIYPKESYKASNMGKSESLSNFISYCLDEYNTDKYSLILWNHGAGPVTGFGVDEKFYDILTLPELQNALHTSVNKSGKKLELVGFDACLMSSLEVADAFAPYANYLVSSQETEPGWGWNYEFLSKLSEPGMNGAGLGKEIIDSYMEYSKQQFDDYPQSQTDLTLSCLDLSKYNAVEESLGDFFNNINKDLSVTTFPKIIRYRSNLRDFGSYSSDYSSGLIDTVQLIEELSENGSNDAEKQVLDALNEMIIYNQSNMMNANGISICFPFNTTDKYKENYLSINEDLEFSPKYTNFLNNLYALQNGETIVTDWDLSDAETSVENTEITEADITSDGSNISIQLSEEQQENFAYAEFYILGNAKDIGFSIPKNRERPEDMYVLVYEGKNVQMDENGKLHALYDNNLLYMNVCDEDGNSNLSFIPMVLTDSDATNTTEKRYTSYVVLSNLTDNIFEDTCESALLQIVKDKEHPDGYVRSAIRLSDDNEIIQAPDKQLLDLKDFNHIEIWCPQIRYLTKDSNGKTLPYYEWEDSSLYVGFDSYIENGITFKSMSIPDPENYSCMFIVYDSQGNATSSELISLK